MSASAQAEIGILGGSGLYAMAAMGNQVEVHLDTPFGKPSDSIRIGEIEGRQVAFLARHGRGHTLLPSDINYRANIYAMKMLGVETDSLRFGRRFHEGSDSPPACGSARSVH